MLAVHEEQWSRYKRLKWATGVFFFGFFPVVALMGLLETQIFHKRIPATASGAFVFLWFVSGAVLTFLFSSWTCPRCGRPFVRYRNVALWTKRCVHCGLPTYSDPLSPTQTN